MEEQIFTESSLKIPVSKESTNRFLMHLPKKPGVYKFLDKSESPLYIGKAKNIKNRLSYYFQDSEYKLKKVRNLLKQAKFIEYTLTSSELEALLLEQHLIKKGKPKFNVQFKDDKGYPWIKLEVTDEFPSAKSYFGKRDEKESFFGPFPSSFAVKDTLKLLQKIFGLRNCSNSFFKNRTRPCLQYEIGRCSAPCVGFISKSDYLDDVQSSELLLSGKAETLISGFYELMDKFSEDKSFEKAAVFRDRISALREVQRNQSIVGHKKERDAISICTLNGKTRIGITHVNNGWVTGHENFILSNFSLKESLLESFLKIHYLNQSDCPPFIIVGDKIKNASLIELALSKNHNKKVKIITKLGKKDKGLLQISETNTKFSFNKDFKVKGAKEAFNSLKEELSIANELKIIESYDISHHSASSVIAGCVVFTENGKCKEKYRLFNISEKNAGNDISSMTETIEKRFFNNNLDLELPDLIIIDGGKAHLNAVRKKLREISVDIPLISVSKGVRRKANMDSIHTLNGVSKMVSSRSIAHSFIQEIRDETHRFCISAHKKRKAKKSINSSLDNVSGVGKKRKKLLIRYFGSVEQVKRASADDLINVPGLGKKTALSIYNQLN